MKNNELPTLINSACINLGDAIEKYYRGTSPQVDYYQFVRLVLLQALDMAEHRDWRIG